MRRSPGHAKKESVRAISPDRYRVSLSISKNLNDKLNRLKDLLSHVDPNMTHEALLNRLAEMGLDRLDPQRKAQRAKARYAVKNARPAIANPDSAAEVRTRYIPAHERHRVANDGLGCAFVDPTTGRRCGSKKFLQLDHRQPFSQGGANIAENLRWLCAAHNRWRAGFSPATL